MTTSLVTGAAGFIGSHVCDYLLAMGHTVVGLDDLSGGYIENVPQGVIFQKGSILDDQCVDYLFKQHKPDYVFHLAAYAAENLSHYIRRHNYMVNVVGSANLINDSIEYGVKRFVFTSSAAVYGYGDMPFSETDIPNPVDPYGIAKLAVERDLAAAHEHFGLDYTIFRCHNVYGTRQNLNDPYRNVIGIFMRQCLDGMPMTIYGGGSQTRAFTCVDDIVPYLTKCIENTETRNEIFNVGTDQPRGIGGLAFLISKTLDCPLKVEYLPERREVSHVQTKHSKIRRVMGYLPNRTTPLERGLRDMAEWAKTQPKRESRVFTAIELTKGLPEHWRVK